MSLFEELKRRNVVKVGVLYVIAAWLTLQVAELLFDALELPSTWLRLVLALLILGFPIALIFSWVFELTPEGLKREKDVDRSRSVTGETGRKINVLIIVLLVIAIGTVAVDRLVPEQAEPVARAPVPAPVTTSPAEAPEENPAEAPAGAPERSIAVLPFANMSGDVENEYFADGLSEEILNFLAGVPDLQVTARTSSFQFKGKNADVREIGDALNVANVLEGSVRRAGDRARITAQLIRAADGYHLWSETYDRQMDDVFEIQTEIAESVTRALGVVLDEARRQQMIDAGVREVDAFVYYQRGVEQFWRAHGEHFDLTIMAEAADLFGEAIRIEPDFADAYFMRSDYYAHLATTPGIDETERQAAFASYGDDLAAASQDARSPAQRALIEVDRGLISDDWTTMKARFEAALAPESCHQGVWLETAPLFGYAEELLVHARRRMACDPLNFFHAYDAARAALWAGKPELSLELAQAGIAQAADDVWLKAMEVQAFLALGRYEEAGREARNITIANNRTLAMLSVAVITGDMESAKTLSEKALDEATPWQRMHLSVNLNAITGDRQAANEAAAWVDSIPAGPMMLASMAVECMCGAPFDLEYTPIFAKRLAEAGIDWPPPVILQSADRR